LACFIIYLFSSEVGKIAYRYMYYIIIQMHNLHILYRFDSKIRYNLRVFFTLGNPSERQEQAKDGLRKPALRPDFGYLSWLRGGNKNPYPDSGSPRLYGIEEPGTGWR
jgi:hypothetical protein